MDTIKQVFDHHLAHLSFDKKLANQTYAFQTGFVNKNEDHMAFFGGHLTGVYTVRFTDKDFSRFFDTVADADVEVLRHDLHGLESIYPERKVSSDIFNLTCMYLIHRWLTADSVDEDLRHRSALDVALIFNYRAITALMSWYWRYPADPRLAEATYSNLSYRFLIKKLGTWQDVLLYRCKDLIEPDGLHYKSLFDFTVDDDIVSAIIDSQGRIRDMIKNIYAEFKKAHVSGEKIKTSSSISIDSDGVEIIKDKVHGVESYVNYLLNIISDANSFIKQELIDILIRMMPTIQEKALIRVLKWMSENIHNPAYPDIEKLVKLTLIHSHHYLSRKGYVLTNSKDISDIMVRLRGVYTSSRSNDADLLDMREIGARLIRDAIGKTNDAAISAIRTGIFLYINIRAYTKHHYSS